MRPLTLLPFLAALSLSALTADVASADAPKKPAPPPPSQSLGITEANDFNFTMYGSLRAKPGNFFFSAPSLREALGLTYLGARGNTAKEMSTALRLDPDLTTSASQGKSEINDLQSAKGSASLAIANRLWADKGFVMNADFTKNAVNAYGSPVETVDFSKTPNDARLTINQWVEKQTNDKIKDLLPKPAITSDTRLVITNAIWFKGDWAQQFDKASTRDDAFLVDGNTSASIKVPTMHQTSSFGFTAMDGAKILEMRYAKSDLAMDIVLPDSNTGLSEIEDKLLAGRFTTWTSALSQRKVDVSFPKLTFTWGGSVKGDLQKMGMKDAFDDGKADLSGIASKRASGGNLFVSDVIHKAFIAIDEKGTEAAAATAVIIARESAMIEPPPATFKADHPFVFIIRDVKHNRILFTGRVTNPKT